MLKTVLMVVLGAILVVLMFKVFASPMKLLLKLGFNTLLGFAALYLFDLFGDFTGFTLGVNWLNAVVIAILGVPGFALLLILRWLFRM
jgi:inhibitor of the pro-sigma K processing machinery